MNPKRFQQTRRFVREAAGFFMISLAGLGLDVAVFTWLTAGQGLRPGLANFASGWGGLTLVYFLSSGLLFKRRYSWRIYAIFLLYYTASIGFFSFAIDWIHRHEALAPILSKLVTLPFSFGCNFLFNKLCLGLKTPRA